MIFRWQSSLDQKSSSSSVWSFAFDFSGFILTPKNSKQNSLGVD